MNFLSQLLRGISFIPALVSGIESLFASKNGVEKKDAAMSFLESALGTVDAVPRCRFWRARSAPWTRSRNGRLSIPGSLRMGYRRSSMGRWNV